MKDTIAAISTSLGVGAISIIRVSGLDAISIVNKIFNGKDLEKVASHTINYGHIIFNNEIIDEVLVSIMKSPKTFTAEDIVEINCHGGIATTNKVLELVLTNGARLAEPGEFTKRAFMNGRIDLIEAESVMDLINGQTDKARKVAIKGLGGEVSGKIKKLRQEIIELLASIEVNIDYPEYEDAEDITNSVINKKLNSLISQIKNIIDDSENGLLIKSGIKTVIIGRPNVGKSSILNRLIDEEKAIVTDVAGTTRDIVEGSVSINGVLLDLIDTAGIRQTDNIVEQIGVKKSILMIEQADLIIAVLNSNEKITEEDKEILDKIQRKNSIVVLNKCDLECKLDISQLNGLNVIRTNTIDLDGVKSLKEKIVELFNLDKLEKTDYACLSNVRQISLAKQALNSLYNAKESIDKDIPTDMIEIDIKQTWNILGEIIGETYSDELIDQLFSQFCLGK